jgi:hypothetical protein
MNVETIEMDPRIARIKARDYYAQVKAGRERRREELAQRAKAAGSELGRVRIEKTRMEHEDEELLHAYRALARGQRILNLPSVMRQTGVQKDTHFPALAIARADWRSCYFNIDYGAAWFTEERNVPYNTNARRGPRCIKMPLSIYPAQTTDTHWRSRSNLASYPLKAIVPSIPAHLRPKALENYHILWDAEWAPQPPTDPILLSRVSETIFVVVAQWDLTALERGVLERRLLAP